MYGMFDPKTFHVIPIGKEFNARCDFCITKTVDGVVSVYPNPFSFKKFEKSIIFARSIGSKEANITGGGEPMLSKDLRLIIGILSVHFGKVAMHTNGSLLSRSNIDGIAVSGLSNIIISRVHHLDDINDSIMHVKYENPIEDSIQMLLDSGIDVELSCILVEQGVRYLDDLREYVRWAKSIGVKKVLLRMNYSPGKTREKGFVSGLHPTYQDVYGRDVHEMDGIAIRIGPYKKIDDEHLIFAPDNHLYSSWIHRSSMIM
jgi:molybdenum cofactor biosynthesis enzyme MoaA